jgi:DNA invertase Pin-like site-specific DNA recombinase
VRRQLRAIKRYAARRQFSLHDVYADAGVSGITLARPQLSQLLADCNAGRIKTVIATDPDRLSRDTGQLIALLDLFQKSRRARVEFTSRTAARQSKFPTISARGRSTSAPDLVAAVSQ